MAANTDTAGIRPFRVEFPDADLADLRARILHTRWPERETVTDRSQGPQLATMRELARYWAQEYDWRRCEARLNSFPNFITEIDGLDIHFIHVRPDALPIVVSHGWPYSVAALLKIIEPLTDPTAHGGTPADAFHTNMACVVPDDIGNLFQQNVIGAADALANLPAGLSDEERAACEQLDFTWKHVTYALQQGSRPQTLTGLADSPVFLAAWMTDLEVKSLALISRAFDGSPESLSRDDVLDNITLYWLTNTGVSSARLYAENRSSFFAAKGVRLPVAVSVFADELYLPPRSWAQRAYPNLVHYHLLPEGGHYPAWEQPGAFVDEVRTGLRSLR